MRVKQVNQANMIFNLAESKSYLIWLARLWNFIYIAYTPWLAPWLSLQHCDAAAVDPMPIIGQLQLWRALLLLLPVATPAPTWLIPVLLARGDDSNKLFLRPAATALSKSLRRRAVERQRNAILRFQLINICDNWLTMGGAGWQLQPGWPVWPVVYFTFCGYIIW